MARRALRLCLLVLLATPAWAAPAGKVIANLDLSEPFSTRSPWRAVATQGPPMEDFGGGAAPGVIAICVRPKLGSVCVPRCADTNAASNLFAQDHEIRVLQIVHAHGRTGQPLLLLQTASIRAGDGGQVLRTRVLAYRPAQDRFVEVYSNATGSNNNQETRFIERGPLAGDIVSATPTEHAPYDYWIAVSAFGPDGAYRQTLRYRSATRYNGGNRLAVIDSEMADIERRLGVWRPGMALPLPAGRCSKPHLVRMELWCD